ncbi:hypothetical protein ABT247_05080 [Kitasatospora sp. NPDC001539]|uniref:hypothetical protein n=1 Tax=Kitasatospora sp. NPDC001539 TaxID=3154384 RepID=UPI00332A8431
MKIQRTRSKAVAVISATVLMFLSTALAAQPASADVATVGIKGCRSYDGGHTCAWAPEAGSVSLLPSVGGYGYNDLVGTVQANGPSNLNILVCQQLLGVNPSTGATWQVADGGCDTWAPASFENGSEAFFHDYGPQNYGTYVVQEGFWATIDGHYGYYGGAQSGRIVVFQPCSRCN